MNNTLHNRKLSSRNLIFLLFIFAILVAQISQFTLNNKKENCNTQQSLANNPR